MSAVDLGGGGHSKKKGTGGIKKPKRVGVKQDMTPLVDVAFLLLTFFMFATTMSQPQIMEMQMPPDMKTDVIVQESRMFTIFVRGDNKIFYKAGLEPTMHPVELKALKNLAVQKNAEKENDLVTSLKVDQNAKYAILVSVLDELNQAEGVLTQQYRQKAMKRERRFAITPMDSVSKEELGKL